MEATEWAKASREQIDAAKEFIGKLTSKNFCPDHFANPSKHMIQYVFFGKIKIQQIQKLI